MKTPVKEKKINIFQRSYLQNEAQSKSPFRLKAKLGTPRR
jgi:hypothetical protein